MFLRDECYECPYQEDEWYHGKDGEWHRRCDDCAIMKEEDELDECESIRADICYECAGYGDDYYFDEDGELVSSCDTCPFNSRRRDTTVVLE